MQVQELIAKLSGLPMDSEVVVRRNVVFLPTEHSIKIKAEETLPITDVQQDANVVVLGCKEKP